MKIICPRVVLLLFLLLVIIFGTVQAYSQQVAPHPATNGNTQHARLTAVRYSTGEDHVRVVLEFNRAVEYLPGTAVHPDRIFFDLSSTDLAATLPSRIVVGDPILKSIRVAPYQPRITRVVLDLTQPVPHNTFFVADPPRLVIELARNGDTESHPDSAHVRRPSASSVAVDTRAGPGEQVPSVRSKGGGRSTAVSKDLDSTFLAPSSNHSSVAPVQSVTVGASPSAVITEQKSQIEHTPLTYPNQTGVVIRSSPSVALISGGETQLAERFGAAAKLQQDFAGSADGYLKAAQLGSIDAQFQLGNLYMTGSGVARQPSEAARWYTHAAQQGHALAASNLGVLYANGWGVQKNDTEAVKWFRKAAEQGDAAGCANLGAMYLTGRGVPQSDSLAAKWILGGAQADISEAQYGLATMYANGRGVPRNDVEASKWLQAAVAQNYAPAQLALGKLYLAGAGVPRDYGMALQLFQRSDLPEAWYELGVMYSQGLGTPASEAQAVFWFLKAAEHGFPGAQFAIGRLYQDRDPVVAYSWFAISAASGDENGVKAMNSLASRMTVGQLAEAQERAVSLAKHRPN